MSNMTSTNFVDKKLYNDLYKFDAEKELKTYLAPLEENSKKIENQNFLIKSDVKKIQQVKIIKSDVFLKENELEIKDVSIDTLIKKLFKDKNKLKKNKIQNAKYEDKNVKTHLNKLITGEDAIAFFAKYGNTTPIKFIHCVRDPEWPLNPYKLKIAHDQNELTKAKEYYTVSPSGIVQIYSSSLIDKKCDFLTRKPTEFISLSDWMLESTEFNILSNIKFFKNFMIMKVFRTWKRNQKKRYFDKVRRKITQNVFYCKPAYSSSIFQIKNLISQIHQFKMVDFSQWQQKQVDFEEFKNYQKDVRVKVAREYDNIFEEILQIISKIVNQIRDAKIENYNLDLKHNFVKNLVKQKPLNLIKREKIEKKLRKDLSEHDFRILGKFIRFINYLAIENLIDVNQNTLLHLKTELFKERKNGLFTTSPILNNHSVSFIHKKYDIIDSIEFILGENIKVVRDVPKILGNSAFDQYINDMLKEDEVLASISPNIHHIIQKSAIFNEKTLLIKERIILDFKEAKKKVENNFNHCKRIENERKNFVVEDWIKEKPSLEEIKVKLMTMKEYKKDSSERIKDYYHGILHVDSQSIRNILSSFINDCLKKITEYLYNFTKQKVKDTLKDFNDYNNSLVLKVNNLEDFSVLIKNYEAVLNKKSLIENRKEEIEKMYKLLNQVNFSLMREDKSNRDDIVKKAEEIDRNLSAAEDKIRSQKEIFKKKYDEFGESIREEIKKIELSLNADKYSKIETPVREAIRKLEEIEEKMNSVKINYSVIEEYSKLMEFELDEQLPSFPDLETNFNSINVLWRNLDYYQKKREEWYKSNFLAIEPKSIKQEINKFSAYCEENSKLNNEVMQNLVLKVEEDVEVLPVILSLGNKDLQEKHWNDIFKSLEKGYELKEQEFFSLEELLNIGVMNKLAEIEDISNKASGEEEIKKNLLEIKDEWYKKDFVVKNYRDFKEKFILTKTGDIFEKLESDLMKIQGIMNSKFIKEIKTEVCDWEKKLLLFQETLEEWLMCQKQWIYLENVFSADDIQKQLPSEYNKFFKIDKFFKETMVNCFKKPSVVENIPNNELLKKFVDANKNLEIIEKMLEDYLDLKRNLFPRFYFLSNDELLEIFSQTRNPQAVQPFIEKCFDNIKKITFNQNSKNQEIESMISSEPEKDPEEVKFIENVVAKGAIEKWLLDIEKMMKKTLYQLLIQCLQESFTFENEILPKSLYFKYPAQIILVANMIKWTYFLENAIQKNEIKAFVDSINRKITTLVELIKEPLTIGNRELIKNLIILDVHNRDITKTLQDIHFLQISNFNYQKQLRYYHYEENGVPDCFIKQTNTKIQYGYEYLGNSPRLIITPLTDRCYLTLTSAFALSYGGCLSGPAGTGKTETTKDLGKAIAVICLVYNCSEEVTNKTMAQFFNGLAQNGAWACFDEFNRIEIDVLSVIAQQILCVQTALKMNLSSFDFEGSFIKLNKNFGVFVTMNPGYVGRKELPHNLSKLFRPVSMMIPNYELITKIILFSEGFLDASELSRKMVTLYKLSSEQLSKKKHYDFGMRAVKSVLTMAGCLRRMNPEMDEKNLVLKAMKDSNLPKFSNEDIPLFEGITQDLFPNLKPNELYNVDLKNSIDKYMELNNLQSDPGFILKVLQFYEVSLIRHGTMIVGAAGSGKSTLIETLKNSLDYLDDPISFCKLNPKSLSQKELFGYNDEFTGTFIHGVLSKIILAALEETRDNKKWFLFDGPVDADWIENLNTVLDDNRMLCLPDGKRIKLPRNFSMIFEVENLDVASPATVSRCGMVYLDDSFLNPFLIYKTWETKFNKKMQERCAEIFTGKDIVKIIEKIKFFEKIKELLENSLKFVRKNCEEIIPSIDLNLIQSCLNFFETNFFMLIESLNNKIQAIKNKKGKDKFFQNMDIKEHLFLLFGFSLSWSISGNLSKNSKNLFNKKLRMDLVKNSQNIFKNCFSLFDFFYDFENFELNLWKNLIKPYQFQKETQYFKILIQTQETVQIKHLLKQLIFNKSSVFINGQSGVGKTLIINDFLQTEESAEHLMVNSIFSAQTCTKNLQSIFLDKYTQKGKELFPKNQKQMIFFIDDINMPKLDTYGTQPVNELLRQIIDHGGFYDLKKYSFKHVKNTVFITCCAPPSGGRNNISPRLLRHFHMLHISELSEKSMELIFNSILQGYLSQKPSTKFFEKTTEKLVTSSIELYNKFKQDLLPIPAKCHYTFNLRDLSKVFQGVLHNSIENVNTKEDLINSWIHEKTRIFHDRLINRQDREYYFKNLKELCKKYINHDIDQEEIDNLIFSDVVDDQYKRVKDMKELEEKLYHGIKLLNLKNGINLNLVLFKEAIHHLCRIKRVLSFNRGNMVLIGLGGSGRQSLSKIASFMENLFFYKIELKKNYNEISWREDVKGLLKLFISEDFIKYKGVSFLVTSEQIKYESFLEDINNLLNNGEIPNLYTKDELKEIYDLTKEVAVRKKIKLKTKEDVWEYFVDLVRNNLHIILTFSPVGSDLREKCRQFPSIINCSTIDWFDKWSEEALFSVAKKTFTSDHDLKLENELVEKISAISLEINKNVEKETEIFYEQLKRKTYVTPSNFLDFLNLYLKFLKKQKIELPREIQKYELGLEKMKNTKELCEVLQVKIRENQEEMKIANEQNVLLKKDIEQKKIIAEEKEKGCEVEAREIEETRNNVNEMRKMCQQDLEEAIPALIHAQNAVKNIDRGYIASIKTFKVVVKDIEMVLFALNLLFGKKENWDEVKKFLGEMDFLKQLHNLDPITVPKSSWDKLRKNYLDKAEFDSKYLKEKVSEAISALADYCINMEIYYKKKLEIAPKEKKLKDAEEKLSKVEKIMSVKFEELRDIQDKVSFLENKLKESIDKEIELNEKQETAKIHLSRAEKLIIGLEDETLRWEKISKELSSKAEKIEGDNLLLAGAVAYLGSFFTEYRERMLLNWEKTITKHNLSVSENFSLSSIFSDDMTIRSWRLNGLPGDEFSTQNAILMQNSSKWPLMIDPQTQAVKWIKNLKLNEGLIVIKYSDNNLMRIVENAVRYGNIILIENLGEKIDSALDPVLLKLFFKKPGGNIVKINDKEIPYNNDFTLYLTTKLQNPHYLPETTIKVNIINFTVTELGLENQLLGEVVKIEKPELEEQKNILIKQISDDNQQLYDLSEKILKLIINVKGDILEDEKLINTLEASKNTSAVVKNRMIKSNETNKEINKSREIYRAIAERGSLLYFVICQLSNIEPLYEFSLDYVIDFFIRNIRSNKDCLDNISIRVIRLKNSLTELIFKDICRGIFEKDKLLFSFMIALKIQMKKKLITETQWQFFKIFEGEERNDKPDWIQNPSTWKILGNLEDICANLNQISKWLIDFKENFKSLFNKNEINFEDLNFLPGYGFLSNFDKLMILRAFRPEKLENLISQFISISLNENFLKFPIFDLNLVYQNSTPRTPIIIIVSEGVDPIKNLKSLSEEKNSSQVLQLLSLGRGQDEKAKDLIKNSQLNGDWICLQNCHLCPSFLPHLQNILFQNQEQELHENFRIFLTTSKTSEFPVEFLHLSLKVTNEPASGVKASLQRIYGDLEEDFDKEFEKPVFLKPLFFSLAMFHSVLLERRKYGPCGWNIPYNWMNSDFEFSIQQIKNYSTNSKEVPFDMLSLMIGNIFYGGRVTDYNDENLVESLLKGFFNVQCLEKGYVYLPKQNDSHHYQLPNTHTVLDVLNYLDTLPLSDEPGIFGLHANAKITYELQKTEAIKNFFLTFEPTKVEVHSDQNKELLKLIQKFNTNLPKSIEFKKNLSDDSFLIFRDQETERYNNLLSIIKISLYELEQSIKGESIMSEKTEKTLDSFIIKKVPEEWSKNGFLSIKGLDDWFEDLIKRVEFFKTWHSDPNLNCFSFASFFFPQGFITSVLQNYARKTKVPIDSLTINCKILDKYDINFNDPSSSNVVYLKDMLMENGFIDISDQKLIEARPNILCEKMPIVSLEPVLISEHAKISDNIYSCPVYKTSQRYGKLSTTGHSTNFVMYLEIPVKETFSVDHFIRRGTAVILQS